MLDLKRLKRITLHERPLGQVLVGNLLLRPDYAFPKKTEIVLEGVEGLPDRPVFLAKNPTTPCPRARASRWRGWRTSRGTARSSSP